MSRERGNGKRASSSTSETHPLRIYRRKLGWTQAKLARKARLHSKTIIAIERWRNYPSLETRRQILRALNLPYNEHVSIFPRLHRLPARNLEDRAWAQLVTTLQAVHSSTLAHCPPAEAEALSLLKSVALAKCEHRSQDELVGLIEALAKQVSAIRRSAA